LSFHLASSSPYFNIKSVLKAYLLKNLDCQTQSFKESLLGGDPYSISSSHLIVFSRSIIQSQSYYSFSNALSFSSL